MTYAQVAAQVAREWDGRVAVPEDAQPGPVDDLAFWAEVDRRVMEGGGTPAVEEAQSFDHRLHPRNRVGRFIDTPDRPVANASEFFDRQAHGEFVARLRHDFLARAEHRWNSSTEEMEVYKSGMGNLPRVGADDGLWGAREFMAEKEGYASVAEHDAAIQAKLDYLLHPSRSHVAVRVWAQAMPAILDRNEVVNAHDPRHWAQGDDQQKMDTNIEYRAAWEPTVWTIDSDNPRDFPIYGYMADDEEDVPGGIAGGFGDVKLRLRPHVRERTTVSYSDSNWVGVKHGNAIPRPVDRPLHDLVPYNHGSIKFIERLTIPKDAKQNKPPTPPKTGAEAKADPDSHSRMLALRIINWRRSITRGKREARREGEDWRDPETTYGRWVKGMEDKLAKDVDAWEKVQEDLGRWSRWDHGDFFEAQVHGGIRFDEDVEHVEFTKPVSRAITKRLDDLGIAWSAPEVLEEAFVETLHPRDRLGKWVKGLGFKAYKVGGAVRDPLLGKEPKDEDFMVMASPDQIRHAVQATEEGVRIDDLTVRDRVVGLRAFPPVGADGNPDLDHPIPPEGVELAPPRVEVSTGPHRDDFTIVPHPAVLPQVGPEDAPQPSPDEVLQDDALRRDFTANAMYRDLDTNLIVDPTGGLDDVGQNKLVVVGEDSFVEDPLRILRGLRFISQHGLEPDERTLGLMAEHAPQVTALTKKGVSGTAREELDKMLMGEHVGRALRTARDTGVLAHFLPELAPTIGFDQQSKYHDLSLDNHIISAVERGADLDAPLEVRLALLFHDAGKPESAWMGSEGRLHFYERPPVEHTVHLLGQDREVQFAEVHGVQSSTRVFAAFASGMPLGVMSVDERTGTVELVKVEEDVRRQGLATKLLEVARLETGLPLQVDTGLRSPAGAAFAQAQGFGSTGDLTDLDQREADARGAGLMMGVYSADRFTQAGAGREAHEAIGARIAGEALDRLNYPAAVRDRVVRLVAEHMVPTEGGIKSARRWRARVGTDLVDDLLLHRLADMSAKGEADEAHVGMLSTFTDLVRRAAEEKAVANPRDLAITGHDLITAGIPAGPDMGAILRDLVDDVHEDPLHNDRDWLIMRALEIARHRGILQEAFDPNQPRYPRGHPRAGQWRPKITSGAGRIGPKGMANDLAKLKDLVDTAQHASGARGTADNMVPFRERKEWMHPEDLQHIGAEVEKLARRYSTRRAYEERSEALKAEAQAIRDAHYDRYSAAHDQWHGLADEVQKMIEDNNRVPLRDGDTDFARLQAMVDQHMAAHGHGPRPSLENTILPDEQKRVRAAEDERVKLAKDMEKADRDALLGVLKELRPFGGKVRLTDKDAFDVDREYHGPEERRNTITERRRYLDEFYAMHRDYEASMREVTKLLPTEWIEKSNAAGPTRVRFTDARASAGLRDPEPDEQTKLAKALKDHLKSGHTYVGRFDSTGPFGSVYITKRQENPDFPGMAPIYDVVRVEAGPTNAAIILPDWDLAKVNRDALPPIPRRTTNDPRFNPDPSIERYLAQGPREDDFDYNTPKDERPVGGPMEYAGFSEPWHVLRSKDGRLWWANWTGKLQGAVEEKEGMSPVARSNIGILDRVLPYTFEQTRARPYEYVSELRIDPDPKEVSTLLHEYAHRLEAVIGPERSSGYRALNDLMIGWHARRTEGETVRMLRDVTGNEAYRPDEVTKPDGFFDAYVGKVYQARTHGGVPYLPTEVLTMGLQYLWYPAWRRDLNDDPDMRNLMVGLLAAL